MRVFAGLLMVVALGVVGCGESEEVKLTQQKRDFVTQKLRDPLTVQFKDEKLTDKGWLCGQINSKNAYGAYVGFTRFAVRSDDDAWIEGQGYVGKGSQSSERTLEVLDAQIQVMKQLVETRKANPQFVPPSDGEIEDMAEAQRFSDNWQKYCS